MKVLLVILAAVSFSTSVFAAGKCDKVALETAQAKLDQKAQAYGFDASDIDNSTLKSTDSDSGKSVYSVTGYIYKAEYTVQMELNSACGRIGPVKIVESVY